MTSTKIAALAKKIIPSTIATKIKQQRYAAKNYINSYDFVDVSLNLLAELKVEKITLDGLSLVDKNAIKTELSQGSIIIVRQGLQVLNLKQKLDQIAFDTIQAVFGTDVLSIIKQKGFENFHHAVSDPEKLIQFYKLMSKNSQSYSVNLMAKLVYYVLEQRESFCAEVQPNARLILPFDFTSSNEWLAKNPETSIGPGKITVHGPHQDSWFLHPLNTINVWCAIGSVVSGNGLSIFPQSWSSRPTYSRTPFGAKISADQYLGPAVNFDLDPGDMVVFNAEHVHSSEINQTDLSRFIISMRMTFDEPQYFDAEVYDYRQVSFGSKAKPSLEIERNPRINFYNNHPHFSTSEREIKIPDSKTRCKDIEQLDIKEEENCLTFDSNALAENEIKLVTNAICVTKITGQIYSFSRFCTHEGADLALGQIKNQRVVCPWHNLSFNLDTGKSACKSLRQLRLHPCREHNGSVTLECSTIEALSS